MQLVWTLRVSDIRALAQRSMETKGDKTLVCPNSSPPLGGIACSLELEANWLADAEGVELYLFCLPRNTPIDLWYRFEGTFAVAGIPHLTQRFAYDGAKIAGRALGNEAFVAGAMTGGWDEAAWKAVDLPSSGELQIVLTVTATSSTASWCNDSDSSDEESDGDSEHN